MVRTETQETVFFKVVVAIDLGLEKGSTQRDRPPTTEEKQNIMLNVDVSCSTSVPELLVTHSRQC